MTDPRFSFQGGTVVALCGGIGGAKLALGLANVIGDERLMIAVNTGDDFEHLGLHISPDIDTVIYTLAGVANPETGWGRADESWNFMETLGTLGGETWFQLGDKDLAMHVERTRRLSAGESLSTITDEARRKLAIPVRIAPMSDDPVRTMVETDEGILTFQRYFVDRRAEPVLKAVYFDGAEEARLAPAVRSALAAPDLAAVIICPSNPYLSVDPILAVPGMRQALRDAKAPVIAVTPLVGGDAVKGPTAKIMRELGGAVTAAAVAAHYGPLIDGFILDRQDAESFGDIAVRVASEQTLMITLDDKVSLAQAVLAFASRLAGEQIPAKEHVA